MRLFHIIAVMVIVLLNLLWGCGQYPQQKQLQQNIIYRDEHSTVFLDGKKLIVQKGSEYRYLPVPETVLAATGRLLNKPSREIPLKGIAVKDGVILRGERNLYVIVLEPKPGILISYPDPKTVKDKIIINKKENLLYFYKLGNLVKAYPIATGKEDSFTPEGTFRIVNKVPYPKGKDPDSQLGARWMGLSVPYNKDKRATQDLRAPRGLKYGIHGTNEPESIGKHVSAGCIRLNNEDVSELYDMITLGAEVEIR